MYVKPNPWNRNALLCLILGGVTLFHASVANASTISSSDQPAEQKTSKYYSVSTVTLPNGADFEKTVINGPPTPPPGFEAARLAVSLPEADAVAGIKTLTVPAFEWVFGCSSVSAAMIAGYYDRTYYPRIYTGPSNGGVMPLDESTFWPTWSDGYSTYPNNPLIASKNGVDGRATKGSIDDYWIEYLSSADDPYITGAWAQHAWSDAIGDYMMTSQSAFGSVDGSTWFYTWKSSAKPLTCDVMEENDLPDGTVGRRHFYEARGYVVKDCYNQKTDNNKGGFTFAKFKAEIDAGNPVLLNLEGHSIVGVGYDSSTKTVYIHDTWDRDDHTMNWGGSYSGMPLLSVSIVHLSPPKISVSPKSINLGSVKSETPSVSKSLTISNTANGGSKLEVGTMEISGTDAADFNVINPCTDLLAKGEYCTPSVTINSSTFGKKSATLTINSYDPKKPAVSVKLAATVAPPTISASPSSLNFGKVSTGSTSAPKTITIKNTGLSDLKITSVAPEAGTSFALTNSCTTVAKGASCPITVTFTPASLGSITDTIDITSNVPTKLLLKVKLSGTGIVIAK
jgi:hypothetical protein